jgi:hypothetical protein
MPRIPDMRSAAGGHTPAALPSLPAQIPEIKEGKAMAQTIASSTVDDRLAAIDAAIRQLGFIITDLAARLGEARGELATGHGPAARPRRRPGRPRHLHLVGADPWTAHQAASLAAITEASR